MRRLLTVLFLLLVAAPLPGQVPARNIDAAEYFWDVDPGAGSGTPLFAFDGSLDETVETMAAYSLPVQMPAGPHTFNVRSRDVDGDWSPVFTTVIHVVEENATPSPRDMRLATAEYFWDTDPGQGNGVAFTAIDGFFDETVEGLVDFAVMVNLPAGPHTFNVRSQDIDGNWSDVFTTIVEVSDQSTPVTPRAMQITQAEYFWDVDPGVGNGSPLLALDGGLDETVESLLQTGITVPAAFGPHTLNVRVKDTDGTWSPLFTTIVDSFALESPPLSRDLIVAEYFWDTDPGPGNGTPMLALDGNLDETVETVLANAGPTPGAYGPHLFNVRVQDSDNQWSPVFSNVVTVGLDKEAGPILTGDRDFDGLSELLEYFLGTDPLKPDRQGDHITGGLAVNPAAGPEERYFVEIHKNPAANDLSLQLELSPDLAGWFSNGDWVNPTIDNGSFLQFFAMPSIEEEPRIFSRLRLELVEP